MKKLYKIYDGVSLVHYEYHIDDDECDAYKNRLTKKGLMQFIKDETERMFGRPKNILYLIESSKGHSILVNKKQFFEIVSQMDNGGKYLQPYYDDDDAGVSIHLDMDEDKKTKTKITIHM